MVLAPSSGTYLQALGNAFLLLFLVPGLLPVEDDEDLVLLHTLHFDMCLLFPDLPHDKFSKSKYSVCTLLSPNKCYSQRNLVWLYFFSTSLMSLSGIVSFFSCALLFIMPIINSYENSLTEASISSWYIQAHQGSYRLPLLMAPSRDERLFLLLPAWTRGCLSGPPAWLGPGFSCHHPHGDSLPHFLFLDLMSSSVSVFLSYFSRAHLPVNSWKRMYEFGVLSPFLDIWSWDVYRLAEWTPLSWIVSRAPPYVSSCYRESGSVLFPEPLEITNTFHPLCRQLRGFTFFSHRNFSKKWFVRFAFLCCVLSGC